MQTAIVDAFKSILPLEARAQPAMSSGNSAAAISAAAHKPHPSPSSEPSHDSDLSAAAANDPVAAQADDSQAAAGSVPPAVLAHDSQAAARSVQPAVLAHDSQATASSVPPAVLAEDSRSAAQFGAALKAGIGGSAQANASMPSAAQGKQSQAAKAKDSLPTQDSASLPAQTRDPGAAHTLDPPAAALPQPEPAITPQPVSVASAGVAVTAQPAALQSAAVQAAKAKAAADIVAAVRAARKAADVAMAPADSTAAAPADAASTAAMPANTKFAAPAMTAAAAAAVPAAVATLNGPAATGTKAPPQPGAASTAAMPAVTSAPTAGPPMASPPTASPTVPAAVSLAMAAPSPAVASAPDTAADLPSTLAASSLSGFKFNFSNSTTMASTPAAAATAVPEFFFPDPTVLLQSSVPKVPASVASRPVATTQSLNPQAPPASNTAAVVKPVSSTAVSDAASPGTAPVPVSLPETAAGTPPIPSSLAAFLDAHAPRALLQGSGGGSSSSMPDGSFTLTPPMPHQTSAIGAVANSPGSMAPWLESEHPASLPSGAGLSGTELPLLPQITPTPFPAPSPSQFPPKLTPGPDQAEGFTSIPASPSLFSPAPQAAHAAAKPQGSKPSKKRNREQAQLTQSEPVAASQTDGTRQIPFSFPPTKESQPVSASLAPPKTAQETLDDDPNPKRLHSDDGIPISKELALMRRVHGDSPIPRVVATAVSPKLRDVKSLVLHKQYRFNLLDICNAIGYFAIGKQHKVEIFLGDLHNSHVHQQQVRTSISCRLPISTIAVHNSYVHQQQVRTSTSCRIPISTIAVHKSYVHQQQVSTSTSTSSSSSRS